VVRLPAVAELKHFVKGHFIVLVADIAGVVQPHLRAIAVVEGKWPRQRLAKTMRRVVSVMRNL
jgi:hypothetical protein